MLELGVKFLLSYFIGSVMGALLILTGILIMTGSMNEIGFWMQEMFPALGRGG